MIHRRIRLRHVPHAFSDDRRSRLIVQSNAPDFITSPTSRAYRASRACNRMINHDYRSSLKAGGGGGGGGGGGWYVAQSYSPANCFKMI